MILHSRDPTLTFTKEANTKQLLNELKQTLIDREEDLKDGKGVVSKISPRFITIN